MDLKKHTYKPRQIIVLQHSVAFRASIEQLSLHWASVYTLEILSPGYLLAYWASSWSLKKRAQWCSYYVFLLNARNFCQQAPWASCAPQNRQTNITKHDKAGFAKMMFGMWLELR